MSALEGSGSPSMKTRINSIKMKFKGMNKYDKIAVGLAAWISLGVVVTVVNLATSSQLRPRSNANGDRIGRPVSYMTTGQAIGHLGQYETVRFKVGYTDTDNNGTEFLDQYKNYTSGFVVCIFSSDLSNYSSDPASTYLGETVDVSGMVTTYDGYIEMLNPVRIAAVS